MPKYILYLSNFCIFKDAQLITMVTLEVIKSNVLNVAIGTFSFDPVIKISFGCSKSRKHMQRTIRQKA